MPLPRRQFLHLLPLPLLLQHLPSTDLQGPMLPSNCSPNFQTDHSLFQRPIIIPNNWPGHDDVQQQLEPPSNFPPSSFSPSSSFPPSSNLFQLPSSLLHYYEDSNSSLDDVQYCFDLFMQQQQPPPEDIISSSINRSSPPILGGRRKAETRLTIDRESKAKRSPSAPRRDRHSKINTAQGLRDRRMRLSVDVASQFFGLQDMLGYEKGSKTVEWLLLQAKNAIQELRRSRRRRLMVQEKSAISDGASSTFSDEETTTSTGISTTARTVVSSKEKLSNKNRKAPFGTLARESREKARARARERTKEKMYRSSKNLSDDTPLFKARDENHSRNVQSVAAEAEVEEHSSSQRKEKEENLVNGSLVIMGKWCPSPSISYYHSTTAAMAQGHLLEEHFYMDKKSWEAYNSQVLL